MLNTVVSPITDPLSTASVLASQRNSTSPKLANKQWCDHCHRPYHTRETCWKIHGKPPNWKPRSQRENAQCDTTTRDGSQLAYAATSIAETKPTSKSVQLIADQVEFLQKFLT